MTTTNQTPLWNSSRKLTLAVLLAIQFITAYAIGTSGLLANSQFTMIPPIALTVLIPVTLFFTTYALSERFRNFVLAQDIRTLTRLQHWRVVGFAFLALYAFDQLPALFALPAGLGDMAIGLSAAFIVSNMERDPDYIFSDGYRRFHLLGLLDFTVALGTAALSSGAFPTLISNGLTSSALDVWPLNLFPSFIVPVFIILQLSALLKVRHLRQQHSATTSFVPAS
ncbi:MAG: hypothetical protein JKX91_08830 [Rhizobiaceae bacterium]|nr:hypothetical protein [Rhizobiaceae bacterium]